MAAGGLAPAAAGPVDIASTLGADVSAFAPTAAGTDVTSIFGGFAPGEVGFGDVPGVSMLGTSQGFAPAEVGGFSGTGGFGAAAPEVAAGGGGFAPAAGGATSDLSALAGVDAAAPTGDLASLSGAGGGAVGGTAAPAAGTGAAAAANPAAGGAGGGFFSNLGNSAIASLTKNPLGIAAAGAGLGYNILQGQKLTQNQQNLTNQANQMAGQGQQLQQYLQSGTLPPGMQQQVDNAKAAAKAQIISGYAARGQTADPSRNSALAQELAAVDTNALELQGKIATNLLTAGINESNMSANLFQALVQMDQTQAKQMGSAIANFASALAGGPKAITIGGTSTA